MLLRPYQLDAVEALRKKVREGAKKVLLICPTGGGKTVVFSHITQSAVERGSRALILAHRTELVSQASGKLLSFGVPHGIIQADFPMALHRPVQVASIQTLRARPNVLTQVDLVVIDEAHHITPENSYSKVLERFPGALVLGVTATPWRLDGKGLGDVFGAYVLARTPRELRDEGYLVPVGGWEYEGIDTTSARVQRGDYVVGDLEASATSRRVVGDIVNEWVLHAGNARSVLFALSVEHSRFMVNAFREAGVVAEHVDGKTPKLEREAILNRLRSGVTRVICNCNVLTEGFDCPELECCILARPTLSTSLALQMIGRVLRIAEGKTAARIHDHAGVLAAHGHPYADRDYSPEKSVKGERKSQGGGAEGMKRCKACKSVIAQWPCDSCGFSPTPQDLKLQYEAEEAARRKQITNDGAAPPKKQDNDAERAEKWRAYWAHDEDRKRSFFNRMVEKHGVDKGQRVYWWFSGKLERAPRQWLEEARATG